MFSIFSKHRLKRLLQIVLVGILIFVCIEGVMMRLTF